MTKEFDTTPYLKPIYTLELEEYETLKAALIAEISRVQDAASVAITSNSQEEAYQIASAKLEETQIQVNLLIGTEYEDAFRIALDAAKTSYHVAHQAYTEASRHIARIDTLRDEALRIWLVQNSGLLYCEWISVDSPIRMREPSTIKFCFENDNYHRHCVFAAEEEGAKDIPAANLDIYGLLKAEPVNPIVRQRHYRVEWFRMSNATIALSTLYADGYRIIHSHVDVDNDLVFVLELGE